MDKSKELIKKYFPDLLILLGIAIASYNLLEPPSDPLNFDITNYHTDYKVLGILMIAIGIDIVIRRYFKK